MHNAFIKQAIKPVNGGHNRAAASLPFRRE